MKSKYKAAFLLPKNAKRTLTDTGWLFESDTNLPDSAMDFLKNNLKLQLDEEYLGIRSYSNELFQAVVLFDEDGNIQHVHIKCYGDSFELLLKNYHKSTLNNGTELFEPST